MHGNKFATILAIVINGWFLISGLLAKTDMYTDIGFALEALSWGYLEIWILYLFTFVLSIFYQCYSHVKLFFKINLKNSVYPVSEQTARLLLWTEFRWLGLIIEKFSLTYYSNLWGHKIHTPKLLALLKSFCEDLPQFIIQMIYIYLNNRNESNIPFVVYMSVFMSVVSLIISFIGFLIATTSILSNKDMSKLKTSWIIKNYSEDNLSSLDYIKEKEINDQIDLHHKLDEFRRMPHETEEQKNKYERMRSEIKIDFNHAWQLNAKLCGLETSTKYIDIFQRELDNELLSQNSYIIKEIHWNSEENEINYDKIKLEFKQNKEQIIQSVENKQNKRRLVWYKPGNIEEFKLKSSPVPPIKNFKLAVPSTFKLKDTNNIENEIDPSESKSVSELSNFSFEISGFVGKLKEQNSNVSQPKIGSNKEINNKITAEFEKFEQVKQIKEIIKTEDSML